ncbi:uncharacterized protein [Argopecten irradians]|uniref:uncharacterized protein n=1 Tax=Argopecten irradians TaxID=31199 RepID=UPI00371D28AF
MVDTRCLSGVTIWLLTCLLLIISVTGLVEEIPMPKELEECYKFRTQNISITEFVSEDINIFCITQFLYSSTHLRPHHKVANESILYVQELMRQMFGESYNQRSRTRRRHKRQVVAIPDQPRIRQLIPPRRGLQPTSWLGQIPGLGEIPGLGRIPGPGLGRPQLLLPRRAGRRWVRREIRSLSRREWVDFVNRINQLKRTPVGLSNRYDALADAHRMAVPIAHNGPNFLGWHRLIIALLEQALGIAIPYWDCRLDFYMPRPTESIVWTDAFFGPGFGEVRSGPFANWVTPTGTPLIRNIGSAGSLINEDMVANVMSRVDINDVTEPSAGPFTFERIHNAPHVWIDGQMASSETTAYDPVFFVLHAFIDYLWSLFRHRQRLAGINPATAYPDSPDPRQGPGAQMIPFNYRCIYGYSEFLERRVIYARPPRCPFCGGYAQCLQGRCVSIAVPGIARGPGQEISRFTGGQGIAGPVFASPASDAGTASIGTKFQTDFHDSRNNRAKRHVQEVRKQHDLIASKDNSQINIPYQNTFELNGKSSIDLWAFVPVKIIFERPPQLRFKSYPIQNGNVSRTHDMFMPSTDPDTNQRQQALYKYCQVSGSGASKVYVQTDGIDYSGRYKDYAVVDERQAISSSMTYVGVKNPMDGTAEFYMNAYDSCGRVCRPQCLSSKGYKPCSGAFRVTSSFPMMYGLTYDDAIKRNWMNGGVLSTEMNSAEIPVVFICEVQKTWLWS